MSLMTRSRSTASGIVILAVALVLQLAFPAVPAYSDLDQSVEIKGLSLRSLAHSDDSQQNRDLFRATQVIGFILIDGISAPDCILIVGVEPGRPALHWDDLAVAYQNQRAGSQRPYCSLDPSPETIRQLAIISEKAAAAKDADQLEQASTEFARAAGAPQLVRLAGIPRDSHFARVMVDADYLLKRLSLGTETVPGIRSAIETEGNQTSPLRASPTFRRFFFTPGPLRYLRNDRSYMLARCSLLLRDEDVSRLHGDVSTHDSTTSAFARQVTREYGRLSAAKPVYFELESLFRFVALSELLIDAATRAGCLPAIDELIASIPLARFPTPARVLGQYARIMTEHAVSQSYGSITTRSGVLACGGIDIAIHIDDRDLVNTPVNVARVASITRQTLASRPSTQAGTWRVPAAPVRELVIKITLDASGGDKTTTPTVSVTPGSPGRDQGSPLPAQRRLEGRSPPFVPISLLALGVVGACGAVLLHRRRMRRAAPRRASPGPTLASEVFLSYARADRDRADQLARSLREWGVSVYQDVNEIPGGVSWREEIDSAIRASRVVMVLLSARALRSDHIPKELDIASRAAKPIVPVELERVELTGELSYQIGNLHRIALHGHRRREIVTSLLQTLSTYGVTIGSREESHPHGS